MIGPHLQRVWAAARVWHPLQWFLGFHGSFHDAQNVLLGVTFLWRVLEKLIRTALFFLFYFFGPKSFWKIVNSMSAACGLIDLMACYKCKMQFFKILLHCKTWNYFLFFLLEFEHPLLSSFCAPKFDPRPSFVWICHSMAFGLAPIKLCFFEYCLNELRNVAFIFFKMVKY